jgi:hypothetical protein
MQSHYPNKIQRKFASVGIAKNKVWLKEYAFIGGKERPITQTIQLLQGILHAFKKGMGLELTPDHCFGEKGAWLVGNIFPILSAACDCGLLSIKLPMENELLPASDNHGLRCYSFSVQTRAQECGGAA